MKNNTHTLNSIATSCSHWDRKEATWLPLSVFEGSREIAGIAQWSRCRMEPLFNRQVATDTCSGKTDQCLHTLLHCISFLEHMCCYTISHHLKDAQNALGNAASYWDYLHLPPQMFAYARTFRIMIGKSLQLNLEWIQLKHNDAETPPLTAVKPLAMFCHVFPFHKHLSDHTSIGGKAFIQYLVPWVP